MEPAGEPAPEDEPRYDDQGGWDEPYAGEQADQSRDQSRKPAFDEASPAVRRALGTLGWDAVGFSGYGPVSTGETRPKDSRVLTASLLFDGVTLDVSPGNVKNEYTGQTLAVGFAWGFAEDAETFGSLSLHNEKRKVSPAPGPPLDDSDSTTGPGDPRLGVKYRFLETERITAAGGLAFTLPWGDERELYNAHSRIEHQLALSLTAGLNERVFFDGTARLIARESVFNGLTNSGNDLVWANPASLQTVLALTPAIRFAPTDRIMAFGALSLFFTNDRGAKNPGVRLDLGARALATERAGADLVLGIPVASLEQDVGTTTIERDEDVSVGLRFFVEF